MCGIFGIAGFEDKNLMKRMCKVLKHRGPDEEGILTDSFASIGNTRLSIIDLKKGRQPIHNEDNSIFVVANCEIYNYKELRKGLKSKGHTFYTNTDTEVIVHLYEEYSEDTPKYLEGDFAFAILDNIKKTLFLARDHLGVIPLYYLFGNGKFLFASEIKAILEYKPCALNRNALYDFFTYMYVPEDETLFKNIKKLMPGEMIKLTKSSFEKKKYWHLNVKDGRMTQNEILPILRNLIEKAVHSRMMADVSIGVLLSGGIDSAIVTAFMSKFSKEPIKTYSVLFDEEDDKNTRNIVEKFGTDHHEVSFDPKHLNLLPTIVYYNDSLVSDPTLLPVYVIAKLARKDVKAVLTGEGADDIFGGYPIFKMMLNSEYNQMHARPEKRWRRYISLLRDDFSNKEKHHLLGKNAYDSYDYLKKYFDNSLDVFSQVSTLIFENYLPHDLLTKLNTMCMANSIEGRVPFLNISLFDMVNTSIPNKLKIRNGTLKWILRESVKGLIPEQNRLMRKKPFAVPIEDFFGKDIGDQAYNALKNVDEKIFNMEFVREIVDKNKKYKSYSRQIWSLLTFATWYDVFKKKGKLI